MVTRAEAWKTARKALEVAQLKLQRHDKARANLVRKVAHAQTRVSFLSSTHERKPAPQKISTPVEVPRDGGAETADGRAHQGRPLESDSGRARTRTGETAQ